MSEEQLPPEQLTPVVRVDYEKTTSIYISKRQWEGYQVLRSELRGLARCVKQSSKDQQFFGIFVGATLALALAAFTPGTEDVARMVYVGFAVFFGLGGVYFYQRAKASEDEVDQIVRDIEQDQPQRMGGQTCQRDGSQPDLQR